MEKEIVRHYEPHSYLRDLPRPRTLVETYILTEMRRRQAETFKRYLRPSLDNGCWRTKILK